MATNFTNNFKNILDELKSVLRDEFKGAMPIYIGREERQGSQYLMLIPKGSVLKNYSVTSELREYSIDFILVFKDANTTEKGLEQVLRLIARIESLVVDNVMMTLKDATLTRAINCRIETTDISESIDSGYNVLFTYKCDYLGNIS